MSDDRKQTPDDTATPFSVLGRVEDLTGGSGSHVSDTGAGMRDPSGDGDSELFDSLPSR